MKIKLIDHGEVAEAMNKKYGPLYVKGIIAPKSYQGMDKPVENIDVWNILVTNDKMSDQMAYSIVKTLFEKKPELVAVHKEAEEHRPQEPGDRLADPVPSGREEIFRREGHQVQMIPAAGRRRILTEGQRRLFSGAEPGFGGGCRPIW